MTDIARETAEDFDARRPGTERHTFVRRASGLIGRWHPYDVLSAGLLALLFVLVVLTFRDYAITNDEWIQHRYGELIVAYYRSGFTDRSVFELDNLYLYGGLFDIVAVLFSHIVPLDTFDLRHLMCALIGLGGLGAAMAAARRIGGARAGFIAGAALAACGSWYGTMFTTARIFPWPRRWRARCTSCCGPAVIFRLRAGVMSSASAS